MRSRFHILVLILISASGVFFSDCKPKKNLQPTAEDGVENDRAFDGYFIDACTAINTGQYSVAIQLLNRCLELNNKEASVYFQLSKALTLNGEKSKAMQAASQAFQINPKNATYGIWYSNLLRNSGNWKEAIKVLDKSFENNSSNEAVVKELDQLYLTYDTESGVEKRIKLWLTYKSKTAYQINTNLQLIDLYKNTKNYEAAHQLYDEIKKASPRKYQYYIDDANLYLLHHDEARANLNFEKALEINPYNFHLNLILFQKYKTAGQKALASKYLTQAFEDPMTSVDSKLVSCAEMNQKFKQDSTYLPYIKLLARVLNLHYAGHAQASYTAAKFFELTQQYDSALLAYQRTNKLDPNLYDAWSGSIRCSNALHTFEKSVQIAEAALEYYPNQANLYLQIAEIYNRLKQPEKALIYCTSGIIFALEPESGLALLKEQGKSYMMLAKYEDAQKSFLEALTINAEDAELNEYVGDSYYRLKNTAKALEYWKKAAVKNPDNQRINNKIKDEKIAD